MCPRHGWGQCYKSKAARLEACCSWVVEHPDQGMVCAFGIKLSLLLRVVQHPVEVLQGGSSRVAYPKRQGSAHTLAEAEQHTHKAGWRAVRGVRGQDLVFEDEVVALQPQVDKLTTLGVNKIIALGHSGFTVDKRIAQKVKGVDVVIGGHTNTFLYTGAPPSDEVPAGDYPFMVESDDGRQVPVVQAYAFGKYLGYLNITFDDKGNVVRAAGNPILLDSSIPEDPAVKAEVESMKLQLQNFSSQEIGKTIVYLNGTSQACRFRECNMGNLICDAVVYNNLRHPDDNEWNHVSMCIVNGGGIRGPINERNNNGTITLEELLSVLPFGGTFDLLQIKGSMLKAAFEHSVHRHGQGTGELLQVSGIKVLYDLTQKPGSRVVSLKVLCTDCRVPVYVPIQMEKTYKVLLPSFLAGGGDGYYMLKGAPSNHSSGVLLYHRTAFEWGQGRKIPTSSRTCEEDPTSERDGHRIIEL
ncbi:Snake venom 5'-nucleotidase [Varanus komodoensis]|nr:Snake venom 5'-nucleotidase [Varanus komodoensis]